jgi:8-oxo-dGTP pyrophosphatase MutT (NUDIX family)
MFDHHEKRAKAPALRPKDAATLIIVRRDKDGPRVLMGQRHSRMAFQPNKYVFPGGRLDPGDVRLNAGGDLKPHVLAKAAIGISEQRARGLARAAIRETFEEAGILVGERSTEPPRTRAPAWAKFFAYGVVPRLDLLELVARAITPPGRTRRFDARFFMAESGAIAHALDAAENDELLSPAWLSFAEARALDLPMITRAVLDEVEARLNEGADPSRPVPFFRHLHGRGQLGHL